MKTAVYIFLGQYRYDFFVYKFSILSLTLVSEASPHVLRNSSLTTRYIFCTCFTALEIKGLVWAAR